jgi:hypothetical protein
MKLKVVPGFQVTSVLWLMRTRVLPVWFVALSYRFC